MHVLIQLVEVMAMYTLLNMDKNSIQKNYAVLGEGWCQQIHIPVLGWLPTGAISRCKVRLVYNFFFSLYIWLSRNTFIFTVFGERTKTTAIFLLFFPPKLSETWLLVSSIKWNSFEASLRWWLSNRLILFFTVYIIFMKIWSSVFTLLDCSWRHHHIMYKNMGFGDRYRWV